MRIILIGKTSLAGVNFFGLSTRAESGRRVPNYTEVQSSDLTSIKLFKKSFNHIRIVLVFQPMNFLCQ